MSIVNFIVLEKQVLSYGCGSSEKFDTKENLILDLYHFICNYFFQGLLLNFQFFYSILDWNVFILSQLFIHRPWAVFWYV